MADSSPARRERDEDQVEADLAATRDRLTSAVSALVDRVHPQRIKQREVAGAKRFAHVELENLRLLVFNAAGDLRTERVARAGAGAAGFVGFLLLLRRLVGRGRRSRRAGGSGWLAAPSSPPTSSTPPTPVRSARGRRAPAPADDVEGRVRRARRKA